MAYTLLREAQSLLGNSLFNQVPDAVRENLHDRVRDYLGAVAAVQGGLRDIPLERTVYLYEQALAYRNAEVARLYAVLGSLVACADEGRGPWSEPGYRWHEVIEAARLALALPREEKKAGEDPA